MRMPSRSDSSRRPSPAMPSSFRSRTSSAICPMRRALFTWYGISVTMMDERPVFSSVSTVARARTVRMPRPSRYASRIGPCPQMKPAVGKSGPGMYRISSSTVSSGCSISATSASHTSPRLWGGILGANTHAYPGRAIDEQVRNLARQDDRLLRRVVEIGDEIDGLLVDVGKQLLGQLRQTALRVAVGRRRVAVDRAEVALPVDEWIAHVPLLRPRG